MSNGNDILALREWVFAQRLDFSLLYAVTMGLKLDTSTVSREFLHSVRIAIAKVTGVPALSARPVD